MVQFMQNLGKYWLRPFLHTIRLAEIAFLRLKFYYTIDASWIRQEIIFVAYWRRDVIYNLTCCWCCCWSLCCSSSLLRSMVAEAGATPVDVGSPPAPAAAATGWAPLPTMGLCCPGPVWGWPGCWTGAVWAGLVVVWALPCNGRDICCRPVELEAGGGIPRIKVNTTLLHYITGEFKCQGRRSKVAVTKVKNVKFPVWGIFLCQGSRFKVTRTKNTNLWSIRKWGQGSRPWGQGQWSWGQGHKIKFLGHDYCYLRGAVGVSMLGCF